MNRRPASRTKRFAALCAFVLTAAQWPACQHASDDPCPAGLTLDERGGSCVSTGLSQGRAPEVVAEIDFGELKLLNVDIPETLRVGYPDRRTLTVRNDGDVPLDPFTIRFALSRRVPGKIGAYLEHIERDFLGCTNSCATPFDGTCDDGWPGPSDTACLPGTDCGDCGVRGEEWACQKKTNGEGDPQFSCIARGCDYVDDAPCQCDVGCKDEDRNDCCDDYVNRCPEIPTCQADEICEELVGMCYPEITGIAVALYDKILQPGEEGTVEYELALPPDWTAQENYSFIILADEEPLILRNGKVESDPDFEPLPSMTPFHLAAGVYVHPGLVATEVPPPDFDASIKLATNLITLDDSPMNNTPALVANFSLTSLGLPIRELTKVRWYLYLPSFNINRQNYDAANASGTYDQLKRYELMARVGDAFYVEGHLKPDPNNPDAAVVPQGLPLPRGETAEGQACEYTADCVAGLACVNAVCATFDPENPPQSLRDPNRKEGTSVDQTYSLHLRRDDVAQLAETLRVTDRSHAMFDSNGHVVGRLAIEVTTQYGRSGYSEEFSTPVVFDPPEIAFMKPDGSKCERGDANCEPRVARPPPPPPPAASLDPFGSTTGPYDSTNSVCAEDPEKCVVDNLTPTWHVDYGGRWLGAEAQVLNSTSKGYFNGAVVRQHFIADNYAKFYLLNLGDGFDLLKVGAEVDYGTMRTSMQSNTANATVIVPASPKKYRPEITLDDIYSAFGDPGGAAISALQSSITNTLIDADLSRVSCDTQRDGVEFCDWLSPDPDVPGADFTDPEYVNDQMEGLEEGLDRLDKGQTGVVTNDDPAELAYGIEPGRVSLQYSKEISKQVCRPIPIVGPFCVEGKLGAAFSVGLKAAAGFFLDPREIPENKFFSGIQVSAGPYASIGAFASGELSMVVLGVNLTGEVTFIEAELTPTVRLGLAQELLTEPPAPATDPCWARNTGRVQFVGPASLEVMSGRVNISAWTGIKVSFLFITIDLRVTVLDLTLFEFGPVSSWYWELFNDAIDFRSQGLCPGLDTAGLRFNSPARCLGITGEEAYCPQSDSIGSEGDFNSAGYFKRLYTGPSQSGKIIIDGALEPYGPDANGRVVGDYLTFRMGPSWGYGALKNERYACAQQIEEDTTKPELAHGLLDPAGNSVVCDRTDTSTSEETAQHSRYSGEFNGFELNFERPPEGQAFRWIEVKMFTDNMLNMKGPVVRLAPRLGSGGLIVSNTEWESAKEGTFADLARRLDYHEVGRYTVSDYVSSAHPGATVSAPFTNDDFRRMQWIWPKGGTNAGYFRLPFVAASDAYYVRIYCPGTCTATLNYGDHRWRSLQRKTWEHTSQLLATHDGSSADPNPERFPFKSDGKFLIKRGSSQELLVETRRGEPHLLFINAAASGSYRGIGVMMKPVK